MSDKVYVPNTFPTPNVLVDSVMPVISASAFKVLIVITRLTLGWRDKDTTHQAVEIGISGRHGLSALTGLSHQGIISAVRELLGLELILVKKGPRNSRTPNQYALNLNLTTGQLVKNLDQSKNLSSPTSQNFRPVLVKIFDSLKRNTGNTIRTESDKQTPDPQHFPTSKRRIHAAAPAEPEAFSRWHEAYPRHEARADALKAWLKLDPDPALIEKIMSATGRYAEVKASTEMQFIKLPSSWLNGRRWEDEFKEAGSAEDDPERRRELFING